MAENHQFFATTPKGMEELLADELRSFKAQTVAVTRAGVSFEGRLETAYRVCMWSRLANRVFLPIDRFPAPTPERLYGGVKRIRWSDHLSPKETIAVDFASSKSQITHTHFGALKVKDAIVDQLRSIHGERPSVDTLMPDVRVNVYLFEDNATVSIDLSGDSLHRRGYREEQREAPMKENLAAAILKIAGMSPQTQGFLDPMCGSGTLPIEAALIAANRAPGLHRRRHGFDRWHGHVPGVWKRLVEEAKDLEIRDAKKVPTIVGYDQDFRAVRTALANVERAGLRGRVHIEKRELSQADAIAPSGIIVLNPPYGERLGEVEELKGLYKQIGDTFKQRFKGWKGFVFTGSPELAKVVGLKASRRHILFNGPIECRLLEFDLY